MRLNNSSVFVVNSLLSVLIFIIVNDDNDRYCLDGQRLIAISGQNGKSGSEYRTEIETFSRVKFTGN
jgi:hypothetical protein